MNKNVKKNTIAFLLSLILCLACTPLRAFNLYHAAVIESIVYAFTTYLLLKKYSEKRHGTTSIVSYIILGRIIMELPIRLADFDKTLSTLMVTISVMLSIILTGTIYCKRNIYTMALSLVSWGLCVFIGHRMWLDYIAFGPLPHIKTASYTVQTPENEIRLDSIKDRYILLDFWTSSCGVCIQQFPRFQKLYDKYKNDILVRSVFVRYKEDENISYGMCLTDKLGYKFPVWSVDKNSPLIKDLDVKVYPTVIIIDPDKRIIFKGNLDRAEKKIRNTFNH